MPSPATIRKQRLRKTKAQLIDEIDTLEQRAAATPEGGSEFKRREKELAEKESQIRLALDNMPGGMALGDRDLNFVLFNSQYSELYELPDGLIKVGGSFHDVARYQAERGDYGPGDKDDLIEKAVARYRRGEAVSYERAIAGSGRALQINIAPTPEGGYVSIITDITARKRAEEALRDSRELLQAVIDAVPAMINAKDRDSRYLFVNRYQAELYGVAKKNMIGKTAGMLLGRKYGARTRRLDRKVIESGEALPYFEEDHTDAHRACTGNCWPPRCRSRTSRTTCASSSRSLSTSPSASGPRRRCLRPRNAPRKPASWLPKRTACWNRCRTSCPNTSRRRSTPRSSRASSRSRSHRSARS
jgi:PAS domain-containing protein